MSYKWIKLNKVVKRLADQANIPADPDNMDWKKFQDEGGIADPEDPAPIPIDLSNTDNLDRVFKAMALLMRDYCNSLRAGSYTNKSVADLKADFAAKYNSIP